MINYSTYRKLKLPINIFFQTVKRVRNYKDFVPWCKDSWEINKHLKYMNYEQLAGKFPGLIKNKSSANKLKQLFEKDKSIKIKNFDGGITVGFNVLDFTYVSNVVAIEPNIILSVTDSSKSNIFKKLESIWIINEADDPSEIIIEYEINFEFKSFMFSNVTNLFLDFLGENIVKSFIEQTKTNLNNESDQEIITESDYSDYLDHKLEKLHLDSERDVTNLRKLLTTLHQTGGVNLQDTEVLLKVIRYNKTILIKLLFLAEIAVWSNQIQLEKIKNEVKYLI